jgi:anti-sigma B factor antagonist
VDLNLSHGSFDTHRVLEVRGEVDVHSAPQLRDRVIDLLDDGALAVVVDLNKLSFIDSTGLGALVAALNRANDRNATLLLACSSERILRLFTITGLDQLFTIHPSAADAAAALAAASE